VIAEVEEIVPLGGLAPETVHTPGPFVDRVVEIPELTEAYGVLVR
jgi:acetate CoA/acetoacetate CoA-transferase alpha subunit